MNALWLKLTSGFFMKEDITRDKVFEQQKVFSDLKRNIETLEKNSVTSLRTWVNLGSEVYMQADVPDTSRIFVDVGLGLSSLGLKLYNILPQGKKSWTGNATWALAWVSCSHLRCVTTVSWQIEDYTRLIASIKAQIKREISKNVMDFKFFLQKG